MFGQVSLCKEYKKDIIYKVYYNRPLTELRHYMSGELPQTLHHQPCPVDPSVVVLTDLHADSKHISQGFLAWNIGLKHKPSALWSSSEAKPPSVSLRFTLSTFQYSSAN